MELVKLSPYRYQPLLDGPHSIRLLRLKPDIDSAEIRCEIFNYRLRTDRSSGPYEALSYVWGNSEQRKRLFVCDNSIWNGTQAYLDVTTNLLAALRRIRDPDIEKNVWIDAICINQKDIEERGSQVGFMASIYAYASRVIVWLGDGQDDCAAAFNLIREATDAHQRDSHGVPARLNNRCRTCEKCKACEECEACKGCEVCKERKSIQQPSRIIRKATDALSGDIHDDKKSISAKFSSQIMALLHVQWFRRIWVSCVLAILTQNLTRHSGSPGSCSRTVCVVHVRNPRDRWRYILSRLASLKALLRTRCRFARLSRLHYSIG